MSTLFPAITERRYADYPRQFSVEYHVDGRTKLPDGKGACSTMASSKAHATRAIILGYCSIVRIFDRRTGQYQFTFKAAAHGITVHDGYVR
jgi:hypothetical protein